MDDAFLFQVSYGGDQVHSHSDKRVQIENNPVTYQIVLQSCVCRKVETQQTINGKKDERKEQWGIKTS